MAHVLILYNAPVLPPDHPDRESEIDVLKTANEFAGILRDGGHAVSLFGVTPDLGPLLAAVRDARPDAVVNLFEGFGDRCETEVGLAALLEWLQLPFTGCPAQDLAVCRNKALAKRVLLGGGLPTAPFFEVEALPVPDNPVGWPAFVKPGCQDASLGIDQGSVVQTRAELERQVGGLLRRFGPPVLVERYLDGREYQVPVVEAPDLRALPPTEMCFPPDPEVPWPILTYTAKWEVGSREFRRTDVPPQPVEPVLSAALQRLALRAYTLLGMRDYGRIDFRVLPGGECFILEGNPNPDAGQYSCLVEGLPGVGLTYADWVRGLVANALRRANRPEPRTPP